jgi:glycosyltransferase involved in cell wall biosynthesis
MTKSKYHSDLIKVKNNIIPNGIHIIESNDIEKIPNLMTCTSSPDRCLVALLRLIPLVRKEIPNAEIHWAYGFSSGISDGGMEKNPRSEKWVKEMKEKINQTEGFKDLGRLSQKEVNELYKKSEFFVYPTRFPEIDCISLTKAMSAGCIPICTPSGAIAEKLGINKQMAKLESTQLDYSLEEGPDFDLFVKGVVQILKGPRTNTNSLKKYANDKYSWEIVSKKWMDKF